MFLPQLRRLSSTFSRFVKPTFKNILNPYQLLHDPKPILNYINIQNLKHRNFESYQSQSILESFKLSRDLLSSVATKEVKISCFDKENRQYNATFNFNKDMKLDVQPMEVPVSTSINLKRHYSIERGLLNVKETVLKNNQIGLVNLPPETTRENITNYLTVVSQNILDINIQYCVLGLPSYVTITFKNAEDVIKARQFINSQPLIWRDRSIVVKTSENNERELIKNRKIAINGLEKGRDPLDLLAQLSKFGRIVHFDFPHIMRRNAPKQELYSIYRDSPGLIKIREQFSNGHVQEEYYPKPEEAKKKSQKAQDFSEIFYDQYTKQNDMYARRLQYAEQITIYPDSDTKVLVQNRGYCIVLFSCTEQAQNCYFHLHQKYDVDVVNDYEFHFDKKLKQDLLRYIDNQSIRRQALAMKNRTDPSLKTLEEEEDAMKDIYIKLDDLAQMELEKAQQEQGSLEEQQGASDDLDQQSEFEDESEYKQEDLEDVDEPEEAVQQQVEPQEQAINEEQLNSEQREFQEYKRMFPYAAKNQAQIQKDTKIAQKLQQEYEEKQSINDYFETDVTQILGRPRSTYSRKQEKNYDNAKNSQANLANLGIKYSSQTNRVGRSFSELAQIQLFGKVIKRQKKSRKLKDVSLKNTQIKFEYDPEATRLVKELKQLNKYDLVDIDEAQTQLISAQQANIRDLINEESKEVYDYIKAYGELPPEYQTQFQKGQNLEQNNQVEQLEEGQQVEEDGNDTPKANFSMMRQPGIYRAATKNEKTKQLISYNIMVRKLVNEYFGRFDLNTLSSQRKTYELPTLNPKELKFSDNTSFLVEDDLPKVLNFHIDQQEALENFNIYHQKEQAFKSLPIGERQRILKDQKQNQEQINLNLADVGIVEEVFEAPQDAYKTVEELNLYHSKFGQHYSVLQKDGLRYIVKAIREQSLYPINEIQKIKSMEIPEDAISKEQQQISRKLQESMSDQNVSILQVLLSNGYSRESIASLLEDTAQLTKVPVKTLQILLDLKQCHSQIIEFDIQNQLKFQKLRMQKQKLTPQTLIKTTEANELLQRIQESAFVVSKYKQL